MSTKGDLADRAGLCPVSVWDGWNSRSCGKPTKRSGMCGIHASAKERRERNDATRRKDDAERARLTAEAKEFARRINELTGLALFTHGPGELHLDVADARVWIRNRESSGGSS